MTRFSEQAILTSWHRNAKPWIQAVQTQQIESRKRVTNAAMINAIRQYIPQISGLQLLDLGCGEGWLVRALDLEGLQIHGVDGCPALIEEARRLGGGTFELLPYQDMTAASFLTRFDAIACNFSLFGDNSVRMLLAYMPFWLKPQGKVIIQTLHPVTACGEEPYTSGWRAGSWDGFSAEFVDPAPWYFRTIAEWIQNFRDARLTLVDCIEPIFPESKQPASMIFVLSTKAASRSIG